MIRATDIYKYLDYREFLRNFYESKKKSNPVYSHRFIALKLGIKSSGFFSEVVNGRRNLSTKNIVQFSEFIKLNSDEAQYFENLVRFNQSKTIVEKKFWLKNIMLCKHIDVKLLNKDVYQYFSNWYNTAIRELLFFYKFSGNYKALAATLVPSIKVDEAKSAINLLEKIGLIRKTKKGYYEQSDAIISTGDSVRSVEVAQFQLKMMEHALKVIDNIPAEEREVSTLTISLSQAGFEEIKEVIQKTKKQILKIAKLDSNENRVYQLNIQYFPLSANHFIKQKNDALPRRTS